jgi:hypothetical protein
MSGPAAMPAGHGGTTMDNQSPEMEKLSHELRALMRAWIEHPENEGLKARYTAAQNEYQRLREIWQNGQEAAASSS